MKQPETLNEAFKIAKKYKSYEEFNDLDLNFSRIKAKDFNNNKNLNKSYNSSSYCEKVNNEKKSNNNFINHNNKNNYKHNTDNKIDQLCDKFENLKVFLANKSNSKQTTIIYYNCRDEGHYSNKCTKPCKKCKGSHIKISCPFIAINKKVPEQLLSENQN